MCNILYRMQNVNEFYTVISLKTFSFEIVFFIFIRCNIQTNLRLTSNNLLTITKFIHSKFNALKKIFNPSIFSKHTKKLLVTIEKPSVPAIFIITENTDKTSTLFACWQSLLPQNPTITSKKNRFLKIKSVCFVFNTSVFFLPRNFVRIKKDKFKKNTINRPF